jgi:putative component of membrane protein insertase Oxa1/YidC/SpoIIIJ protein YidD
MLALVMYEFNTVLCGASVSAIRWYQVQLSPRKGYSCAYRMRTGDESCSEFARQAFESGDWWSALFAMIKRFRLCGEAARLLREHQRFFETHALQDLYADGPPEQKPPDSQRTKDDSNKKCAGEVAVKCCLPMCATWVCGP